MLSLQSSLTRRAVDDQQVNNQWYEVVRSPLAYIHTRERCTHSPQTLEKVTVVASAMHSSMDALRG